MGRNCTGRRLSSYIDSYELLILDPRNKIILEAMNKLKIEIGLDAFSPLFTEVGDAVCEELVEDDAAEVTSEVWLGVRLLEPPVAVVSAKDRDVPPGSTESVGKISVSVSVGALSKELVAGTGDPLNFGAVTEKPLVWQSSVTAARVSFR